MKGSKPLKRSAPLRHGSGFAGSSMATFRPIRCRVKLGGCGESFYRKRKDQIACGEDCAARMGPNIASKQAEKAAKEARNSERAASNAAREALKRVPDLKKEAQEAVNAWVRLRDAGKGCFVCGAFLQLGGLGGGFDAGHIRSRSQADHLRFDERNVHGQCKHCNAPGATKDHVMREAAARLLGQEAADALYADNRVHKWQRDELRQIRDTYRAKARQLKKERE